ncbi:MAG TPA: hypothetical protein ENK21_08860 [Trueperaceae bacterium]|nr:hypothetical protein [Trueperaceae bacterium]
MAISKDDLVKQVVKVANHLAQKHRVNMYSADSKRATDIMFLSIWGERSAVLKIPFAMLEHLQYVDIEFVQTGRRGGEYLLLLVITQKIIKQPLRTPERRVKLQNREYYSQDYPRNIFNSQHQ